MIYVFGDYELDTRLYELRRSGDPCPLGPQVFNVLSYLVAHRDRVVSKDELTEHRWPSEFVSDATVHQHVTAVRKAAGETRLGSCAVAAVAPQADNSSPITSSTERIPLRMELFPIEPSLAQL